MFALVFWFFDWLYQKCLATRKYVLIFKLTAGLFDLPSLNVEKHFALVVASKLVRQNFAVYVEQQSLNHVYPKNKVFVWSLIIQ